MSYSLRGRLESRLAVVLLPFLAACALSVAFATWWPVQVAGVMIAVGLALDASVWHRLFPYQPGWVALPLGLVELWATMNLARLLGIDAPFWAAVAFFVGSWLVAQLLSHAGLPLLHLTYAEDGGELGRGGSALSVAAPATLLAVLGIAWAMQPPLVRLTAGTHEGPLVIDHAQRLVGEDGAVVLGGIVIAADDVTVENVTVVGGENGITVDDADDVVLDRVRVVRAEMDGINVRRSEITIRDCEVLSLGSHYSQGIDISFSMHRQPSLVDRCRVEGAWEGIVSHSSTVRLRDNTVRATTSRGIAVTEMSMGDVEGNTIEGARGVGIFCGDYSHCEISDNTVSGMRADRTSSDGMRAGYAIQSHFWARAEVEDNRLSGNAYDHGAFAGGRISPR